MPHYLNKKAVLLWFFYCIFSKKHFGKEQDVHFFVLRISTLLFLPLDDALNPSMKKKCLTQSKQTLSSDLKSNIYKVQKLYFLLDKAVQILVGPSSYTGWLWFCICPLYFRIQTEEDILSGTCQFMAEKKWTHAPQFENGTCGHIPMTQARHTVRIDFNR